MCREKGEGEQELAKTETGTHSMPLAETSFDDLKRRISTPQVVDSQKKLVDTGKEYHPQSKCPETYFELTFIIFLLSNYQ